MAPRSKTKKLQADQALLDGLEQNNASSTFTLQSDPQTTAQIAAVLTARVAKGEAAVAARAAYRQAVLDSNAEDAKTDA